MFSHSQGAKYAWTEKPVLKLFMFKNTVLGT
jgi:hypothetical protein